jgi:2'-5' RNA ligase
MAKELMWVCALLPLKLNRQLAALCREENKSIRLPEDVFRFPLHISMKKSFQTTEFDAVQAEIIRHMQAQGEIHCRTASVICRKKMLWLPVKPEGEIRAWHDELDQRLLDRFAIPIDRFDATFEPHISLFTKGDPARIKGMGLRLAGKIAPMELTLNRFVIGSSRHGDEFFDI